jgi:hypothetical protein
MFIVLYENADLSGSSFSPFFLGNSPSSIDTSGMWIPGTGIPRLTLTVNGASNETFDVKDSHLVIWPGDTITAVAFSEGTDVTARIALNWRDDI